MMGRKHPGPGAAVLFVQSRSDRLDDHQVVPLLVFWTFPGSARARTALFSLLDDRLSIQR